MTSGSNQSKRILILEGGFGGLYTALHLKKKLRRSLNVEVAKPVSGCG
jgi:NADH dehydrogenase FAD-containing subunit